MRNSEQEDKVIVFDVGGVTLLVLLVAAFGYLALSAWRAPHGIVKWGGLAVSGPLALAFSVALVVAIIGSYKLSRAPYHYAVADVKVAGTPEQVARGTKFIRMCAGCHGDSGKLPLTGQDFGLGAPPIGTLYAPNLTPAGEIKDWSDGEVIRAIREGVHRSGRPLLIMPSEVFRNLSDADVQAIVAALRAQGAAGRPSPPTKLNVLAALFVGSGRFTTSAQPPITGPIIGPAPGVTAEYGQYLVSVLGCRMCHGAELTGGKARTGSLPGPNLTQLVPRWSEAGFVQTIRTGVDPDHHALGNGMPWREYAAFASDTDLKALYAYLHALSPAMPAATP